MEFSEIELLAIKMLVKSEFLYWKKAYDFGYDTFPKNATEEDKEYLEFCSFEMTKFDNILCKIEKKLGGN